MSRFATATTSRFAVCLLAFAMGCQTTTLMAQSADAAPTTEVRPGGHGSFADTVPGYDTLQRLQDAASERRTDALAVTAQGRHFGMASHGHDSPRNVRAIARGQAPRFASPTPTPQSFPTRCLEGNSGEICGDSLYGPLQRPDDLQPQD